MVIRSAVAAAATLVVLAGCAGTGTGERAEAGPSPTGTPSSPAPVEPPEPYTGYPDSIAVLAHSGASGENTDPYEGADTKSNSWATGTNPDVGSVYLRILEKNPQIEGHAENYASPSATLADLEQQAAAAAMQQPPPDLVLIQTIDADLACPADDADYEAFGDGLAGVLDVLRTNAPGTRVFIVTQFGSPATYAKALTPEQRRSIGGTGPCAFVDEQGRVVRRELDRLETIIRGYEEQLAATCEQFETCRHDGGAFSRVVDRPEYWSDDLNHFSVEGHAHAAAVAWKALERAGLMPAE